MMKQKNTLPIVFSFLFIFFCGSEWGNASTSSGLTHEWNEWKNYCDYVSREPRVLENDPELIRVVSENCISLSGGQIRLSQADLIPHGYTPKPDGPEDPVEGKNCIQLNCSYCNSKGQQTCTLFNKCTNTFTTKPMEVSCKPHIQKKLEEIPMLDPLPPPELLPVLPRKPNVDPKPPGFPDRERGNFRSRDFIPSSRF